MHKYDLLGRVAFKVGDAKHLPYPEATFDIVYNAYMFDLIDTSEMPGIICELKKGVKTWRRTCFSKHEQG